MTFSVSRIISDDTLSCAIQIESAGKPLAKARTSTAAGLGQFINQTWLAVITAHRPAWAAGRVNYELLELNRASPCSRFNARCSIEMLARHWEDNGRAMGSYAPGDLYLAHFGGVGTAKKLVRANATAPASSVFSAAAINANRSILAGKTCGQVRTWAAKKMSAAGGRNWIAVYMTGARPNVAPVVKKIATATAAAETMAVGSGSQAGWGVTEWLLALGVVAVVGVGAALVWRFWPRKVPVKVFDEEEG